MDVIRIMMMKYPVGKKILCDFDTKIFINAQF